MSTYQPIASITLASAASSVTFSGIPQTYTDLVCVINSNTTADTQIRIRFNSDSGNNYSATILYGDGTSAGSVRVSNESSGNIGGLGTNWGTTLIHLNNYSNATTYKTILGRYNATSASYGEAGAKLVLWRSTSAITSITFTLPSTYTYASGSTFNLYGIANASITNVAKATGGDTVVTDGTYWYHVFRSSGTFTPTQALTAELLVIAGGGGGGRRHGGGGGAGGLSYHSGKSLLTQAYSVTVGAGGAGATSAGRGNAGSNSIFSDIISNGGGAGLALQAKSEGNGGSGGGSSDYGTSATVGGAATQGNTGGATGYGNNGGAGKDNGSNSLPTGGGGGAGAVGQNAPNTTTPGNGGAGLNTWSTWATATGTGVSGFYAGGGGGSAFGVIAFGTGGSGGGGDGSYNSAGSNGVTNSGGGGGGQGPDTANGGSGGSGIVIVRYAV